MIIQIYTPVATPRIRYILNWIFEERSGHTLVCNEDICRKSEADVFINYAADIKPQCDINIWCHPIMTENGISQQNPVITLFQGQPVFFTHDETFPYDLPFDPFALCFYLISRYEEYLTHDKDEHDRYKSHQSLAVQHNFLDYPLADHWIQVLMDLLGQKSGRRFIQTSSFSLCPTIDIDLPFAYRTKTTKNILALGRDLVKGRWDKVKLRLDFLLHKSDPFDTYDYLMKSLLPFQKEVVFFFLCHYQKPFDENFIIHHELFRETVNKIAEVFNTGIHPSYSSGNDPDKVRNEMHLLSRITGRDITQSRQHFLRVSFPDTYCALIENGIHQDHSMAYPDRTGFRASTCHSFYWYDLINDRPTLLIIHSPCTMDVTLKNYLKLTPDQAIEKVDLLKATVKKFDGRFEFIWHNSSFSALHGWQGWIEVYEALIKNE